MVFKELGMAVAAISLAFAGSASASILINFDNIPTNTPVDGAYSGLGVTFQAGDWITTTGFGQTSQPNLAYSGSGAGSVDVAPGFNGLSFTYGAFTGSTVNVFSGLGGAGALLASYSAAACCTNAFTPVSLSFNGNAHSIVISSGGSQFGWDDLALGDAVPEPATWAMMLLGFGAAGAVIRRRKALSA